MKTLLVGGYFDDVDGGGSSIVTKIEKLIPGVVITYNGGCFEDLKSILETIPDFDVVIWMAEVDNKFPKIREVKKINPKCLLVNTKRNDGGKYSFEELLSRSLEVKANLTIEIRKNEDSRYNFLIFDPLGNAWSERTENLEEIVTNLFNRLRELKSFTRKGTMEYKPTLVAPDRFLDIVHKCADEFHRLINPPENVKRFLGNVSFRCIKGFPSFRDDSGMIVVSKRNIHKRHMSNEDFIAVEDGGDIVCVYGDDKPSVDTPVQLELYKRNPTAKYIIHGHVYVKDAPFTDKVIPCGALEEVECIDKVILENYTLPLFSYGRNGGMAINLLGHGCILIAWNLRFFEGLEFYSRELPEMVKQNKSTTILS